MAFDFDPYDPAVMEDPYPSYRYLRDADPIHYNNVLRSCVLTSFEDVRPCLNDQRLPADRITPYLDRLSPEARDQV